MKCQWLFFWKNKKSISKCHLLKFLPSMLSVNKSSGYYNIHVYYNEQLDSDQPAHFPGLIMVWAVSKQNWAQLFKASLA